MIDNKKGAKRVTMLPLRADGVSSTKEDTNTTNKKRP